MQKCFLRVCEEAAYAGFIASLPLEWRADAPGIGKFREMRPYWVKLMNKRHAVGCVCVHHAKHELLEAAAKQLRVKVHRSRHDGAGDYKYSSRCDCYL